MSEAVAEGGGRAAFFVLKTSKKWFFEKINGVFHYTTVCFGVLFNENLNCLLKFNLEINVTKY